ncbi:MAG: hypothetical protein NC416_18210 [Eubacterium sp.]|nr:hypothetical protein [Eubacterium sp.]
MEFVLFLIGGGLYTWIETLWRGYSHWTMFLLGGLCFVIMGLLNEYKIPWHWCLLRQSIVSAVIITVFEFVTGCIVNLRLGWNIWDYSGLPFNLYGQICLYYFLLWIPLSMFGIILDDWIRYWIYIFLKKWSPWQSVKIREHPHYHLI